MPGAMAKSQMCWRSEKISCRQKRKACPSSLFPPHITWAEEEEGRAFNYKQGIWETCLLEKKEPEKPESASCLLPADPSEQEKSFPVLKRAVVEDSSALNLL
ncbi:unnamed protein product [Victoria cruziana]